MGWPCCYERGFPFVGVNFSFVVCKIVYRLVFLFLFLAWKSDEVRSNRQPDREWLPSKGEGWGGRHQPQGLSWDMSSCQSVPPQGQLRNRAVYRRCKNQVNLSWGNVLHSGWGCPGNAVHWLCHQARSIRCLVSHSEGERLSLQGNLFQSVYSTSKTSLHSWVRPQCPEIYIVCDRPMASMSISI